MLVEEIKEALNNNTFSEVKKQFNLSSRALNKIIKENNFEIKYKRRTRYTNILIPIDSPFNKYIGKKLEDFNNFQKKNSSDTWYSNQIKIYDKLQKDNEFLVGCKLYQVDCLQEDINKLIKKIDINKHCAEVLEQAQKTYDYMGFREEEELYIPEERDIKEYLSDDMIIGYIAEKYGYNKAALIRRILNEG